MCEKRKQFDVEEKMEKMRIVYIEKSTHDRGFVCRWRYDGAEEKTSMKEQIFPLAKKCFIKKATTTSAVMSDSLS